MPKFKGTFRSQKAKLKVDLNDLFGKKVRLTPALKEHIGQAIIDKITERTENKTDVNGSRFKAYSKEYVNSDDFKAYGKTKRYINMELTGDMMASLDITSIKGNKLEISWDDDTNNKKAFNHNTGDTVKKREFLGLMAKESNDIAKKYKKDVTLVKSSAESAATVGALSDVLAAKDSSIDKFLQDIFGDEYENTF